MAMFAAMRGGLVARGACSGRKYPALTSFAIISFEKGTTSLIS
jgi:hypothetical protein